MGNLFIWSPFISLDHILNDFARVSHAHIFFWISARRRPIICYLNFLANYPKSKWLNQKLCNPNLVLDAQSLHKAQWYSNRSYIFFFRFFSSSAITDVGWRNNGYCKFHNTITGKNFKILHAIVQFNLSVWLSLSSLAIVQSIKIF